MRTETLSETNNIETLSSNDGTQDGTFEGRGSCFNRQSHIKNA